jgi:hypothetical protein
VLPALLTPILRRQIRRALLGRAGALAAASVTLRDAQQQVTATSRRLSGLAGVLSRLEAEQALLDQPFSPAMTIDQAWRRHPGAGQVFAQHHLPGCQSCAVRFDETIAEAADAYGLSLPGLLDALNALL